MTGILFTLQLAFALCLAYFIFYKKEPRASILPAILLVKANVIFIILTGNAAFAPAILASYAGMAAVFALIYLFLSGNGGAGAGKDYAVFIIMAVLALFLSGCGANPKNFPKVLKELDLKFVPSRIMAGGQDEVYIGTERDREVYLYGIKDGQRIKSIDAGYNPVEIIGHNGKIYIANEKSASVTIYRQVSGTSQNIDSGGEYPSALAINPEKNLLYVANTGSSNVAIIDLNTNQVIKRLLTGKWPSDLYLTPDNKYLYVSCKYTNTLQLIDAENEEPLFTKIETGVSPVQLIPVDRRHIAIVNEWEYAFNEQSAVLIFDVKNYSIESSIRMDGGIFNGVLSRSKRYLYISAPLKDKVLFVDLKKKQVVYEMTFKDETPRWLEISKDGRELYAGCSNSKKLAVIAVNDLL
jgi:YVTN family beta-propeller protein